MSGECDQCDGRMIYCNCKPLCICQRNGCEISISQQIMKIFSRFEDIGASKQKLLNFHN